MKLKQLHGLRVCAECLVDTPDDPIRNGVFLLKIGSEKLERSIPLCLEHRKKLLQKLSQTLVVKGR